MDEIFTGLSDELLPKEGTPINWIYISIGLVVGVISYLLIKYFMKREKTVTFECDDGKCNIQESTIQETHQTDDPKNLNYCEGDKCYI